MYTNVNSLRNKLDELSAMIEELEPDIIGLTETWMKEDCVFQGYHPAFKHNRSDDKRGGGVMLLVRDHLTVSEHVELSSFGFEEAVWCVIQLTPTHKLLAGVCYRSPSSTRANNLLLNEMFRKTANLQMKALLIMGISIFLKSIGRMALLMDWKEVMQIFSLKLHKMYFCINM